MTESRNNGGVEDDPHYANLVWATRFAFRRVEAAEKLQHLGEIVLKLQIPEELVKAATGRLEREIVPMIEEYFEPGDYFGFEQLISVPLPPPFEIDSARVWQDMHPDNKQEVVTAVGDFFGVAINDPESESFREAVISQFEEPAGDPAEGKSVLVTEMATNNPAILISIRRFPGSDEEPQYLLVRSASSGEGEQI